MQIYSSLREELKNFKVFKTAQQWRWRTTLTSRSVICARTRGSIGMYQLTHLLSSILLKWDISIKKKSRDANWIMHYTNLLVCWAKFSFSQAVDTMAIKSCWIWGRRDAFSMFIFSRVMQGEQLSMAEKKHLSIWRQWNENELRNGKHGKFSSSFSWAALFFHFSLQLFATFLLLSTKKRE